MPELNSRMREGSCGPGLRAGRRQEFNVSVQLFIYKHAYPMLYRVDIIPGDYHAA
jgi:hypothetical protein